MTAPLGDRMLELAADWRVRAARAEGAHAKGLKLMARRWRQCADELVAAVQVAARAAAPDVAHSHRCVGCGLRWTDLPGAELCGDCWRKVQRILRPDPLPPLIDPACAGCHGVGYLETTAGKAVCLICYNRIERILKEAARGEGDSA
jgi:hypothetical protein